VEETSPDILCLQETKLQDEQLLDEMRNIPGYSSAFHYAEKKGYSGVATYVKNEIPILGYSADFGVERFNAEGRVLIHYFKDFTLLNVYFPNGQMNEGRLQYKMDFYAQMMTFCQNLRKEGKNLVICGDYNTAHHPIDLANPKSNEKTSGFLPMERAWIDDFIAAGFVDTFRYFHPEEVKYSWWSYRFSARSRNVGWRIDYHFVNEEFMNKVCGAEIDNETTGSDHCPVILELAL
jgi:exodeoxyribonuclease-3